MEIKDNLIFESIVNSWDDFSQFHFHCVVLHYMMQQTKGIKYALNNLSQPINPYLRDTSYIFMIQRLIRKLLFEKKDWIFRPDSWNQP